MEKSTYSFSAVKKFKISKTWFSVIRKSCKGFKDIKSLKYLGAITTNGTLPPKTYEVSDKKTIESFIPSDVLVKVTIDDIRMRTNLTFGVGSRRKLGGLKVLK